MQRFLVPAKVGCASAMLAGIRLSSSIRPSCSLKASCQHSRQPVGVRSLHRRCTTTETGSLRNTLASRRVTAHTPRTQDLLHRVRKTIQSPFGSRPLSFDFNFPSSSNMPSLTPPQPPPKFDHTPSEITAITQEAIDKTRAILDQVGSLAPEKCNFNSVY